VIRTGVFLGCFEKLKNERKLANNCLFKIKKRKKNFAIMHDREISKPSNEAQFDLKQTTLKQKLIQHSFTKIARTCLGSNFDDLASCGQILLYHFHTTRSFLNSLA